MAFLNWRPTELFYGWWIVAASFFIALYVGGIIFYGFTAFFEPIASELGWSYTQISLAASLRGLEMSLLAPIIGILVDRWGPRRLIFSGAIITALGLILLSRTTSLVMFYGAFALITIGMSSCSMTMLMTAVANWFRSKVGIAIGIAISGFGAGGVLIPGIVRLIDLYEWRMAMTILALGMLVLVLPLSLLFRHKPEQYGYLPDGQPKDTAIFDNGLALPQTIEVDVGAKQALKSGTFWHIALAFLCRTMMVSAVVIHVMPYLSSIGIARARSSLVATAIPLTSIFGRISLGWLGDKRNRRQVAAVAFAMMGLGSICFGYASTSSIWLLVPFLVLFGIGYGGNNALRVALVREHFGRTNFGTVFGLITGVTMLGNIIGPPLAGLVYDTWGSYQGIWFVFAGLSIAALVSVLTIPPVRNPVKMADKS
ncbi:MFS transporter [Chloroflexota bacterium]